MRIDKKQPLVCAYTTPPTIGQIRTLRHRHKITQPEMAAMLGVAHGAVGNWETGRCAMPVGLWELFNWKCTVLHRRRMQAIRAVKGSR